MHAFAGGRGLSINSLVTIIYLINQSILFMSSSGNNYYLLISDETDDKRYSITF